MCKRYMYVYMHNIVLTIHVSNGLKKLCSQIGNVLDSIKASHMHSRDAMICNYVMIYYIKSI